MTASEMNSGMNFIKKLAVYLLPLSIQQWLRKVRAPRIALNFSLDQWSCGESVRPLIRPGDQVIDVGANMGYLTVMFARWVGPQGKVYSLEPVPEIFNVLRYTVQRLKLDQVITHGVGASSKTGESFMEIPRYASGGENLYESRIVELPDPANGLRHVPVHLSRLDDLLLSATSRIAFIKIDVEGHEFEVIQGALAIIERDHPPMVIEISGDPSDKSTSSGQLFQWLKQKGYSAYSSLEGRLIPWEHDAGGVDCIFLQERHVRFAIFAI